MTASSTGETRKDGAISLRPVTLLSAAAFCSSATVRVTDPLLPKIAQEFGVTPGSASVIATTFLVAYSLCQVVYGPLGDRFGKYRMITGVTAVCAVVVTASAAAGSLAALAWLRLGAGAAAAAIVPLAMAYIGDIVPYGERQAVIARFLSGHILGLMFGQAAAGAVIQFVDWRGVFVLLGALYAGVALLLWIELRSPRVADTYGTARLTAGSLVRQFAALTAIPRARLVLIAVFIEGALFFGSFNYVGAFIRQDFGVEYAMVGLLLACFGLGGLSYILSVKTVLGRLGEPGMTVAGGALFVACFVGLSLLPSWWYLAPAIGALGFAYYMYHNTLQTNATQMAPRTRGSAVSAFALCFFLGQGVGVEIFGFVVDHSGYAAAFTTTGAGLLALGIWFALRRRHISDAE